MTADSMIEGRVYLYAFDFPRFRRAAEESIRPANVFHCQGISWRFRFGGEVRVYVNGHLIIGILDDQVLNAYSLGVPLRMEIGDDVCVRVIDTQRRWFRWFRPNTAHVTLEGLECAP